MTTQDKVEVDRAPPLFLFSRSQKNDVYLGCQTQILPCGETRLEIKRHIGKNSQNIVAAPEANINNSIVFKANTFAKIKNPEQRDICCH